MIFGLFLLFTGLYPSGHTMRDIIPVQFKKREILNTVIQNLISSYKLNKYNTGVSAAILLREDEDLCLSVTVS